MSLAVTFDTHSHKLKSAKEKGNISLIPEVCLDIQK